MVDHNEQQTVNHVNGTAMPPTPTTVMNSAVDGPSSVVLPAVSQNVQPAQVSATAATLPPPANTAVTTTATVQNYGRWPPALVTLKLCGLAADGERLWDDLSHAEKYRAVRKFRLRYPGTGVCETVAYIAGKMQKHENEIRRREVMRAHARNGLGM
ncbi:Protein of unknown function [Pyronema omphalodes CBS 100304]|uniref:Uncharacterized protein n=1 Tax=Pyronema omphalodes (strain CBS 100304) TaxID=1076935 RepID=U4L990_PYROM|nr:Protein of unknown function [Pyronema omphalodes CBS 100304]